MAGSEDSCPSVESLVNWLLEHDDSALAELSDDSDVLSAYIDDSWSDQESVLLDDLPDDEVTPSLSASVGLSLGSNSCHRVLSHEKLP